MFIPFDGGVGPMVGILNTPYSDTQNFNKKKEPPAIKKKVYQSQINLKTSQSEWLLVCRPIQKIKESQDTQSPTAQPRVKPEAVALLK